MNTPNDKKPRSFSIKNVLLALATILMTLYIGFNILLYYILKAGDEALP